MKTIISLFVTTALYSAMAFPQSITITGTVMDKDEQPIYGANIYPSGNPLKGVISDLDGAFTLELNSAFKNDTLIISYIGFETIRIPIATIEQALSITLKINTQSLSDIQVVARDPIAENFSVKKIEKLDIYTEPLAQADPLKAITILPASTNTDESANPSLRGSDGDRSRVVLNGVPIYEPVRFSQINGTGYFSVLNPEIIKEQYVYASNPPVSLGNSSAGLVQVSTIDKLTFNQLQISTSLASTGAFLSQGISEKTFFQLYGNNQFSKAFIDLNSPNADHLNSFGTQDVGFNIHSDVSKNLSINFFTYTVKEDFNINAQIFTYPGKAIAQTKRNFSILNARYIHSNSIISFNGSYDIRQENFRLGNIDSDNHRFTTYSSLNYQVSLGANTIETGLNHNHNHITIDDQTSEFFYAASPSSPIDSVSSNPRRNSLESFFHVTQKLSESWILSSGIRTNALYNDTNTYWTSQLGIRYYLNNEHSFLLSGGKYHNYNTPNSFNTEYFLQSSYQAALDYTWRGSAHNFYVALFYKKENDNSDIQNLGTRNFLQSSGLEIAYDRIFGNWIKFYTSFSFLDQKEKISGEIYQGTKDLDYFVKSSISYNNPNVVGISFSFITRPGTHYTEITSANYDPNTDFYKPEFSSVINNLSYSEYNILNFSLNKIIPFRDNSIIAFLSVNNLLNTHNEQILNYNRDYTSYEAEPFQLRSVYFGLVLNLNY